MNKKFALGIAVFFLLCVFGSALLFAGPKKDIIKSLGVANAPGGSQMTPHKALYEISMVSSHSGSQIINISGTMFFEWQPTCEAWTTDHRFNLTYEYSDAPAMRVTSDFSTWEAYDGKTFNFSSRRSRDGEIYEDIRGYAERYEDGTGKATYTMPEGTEFELVKDFVFPMQHTADIVEAIKNEASSPRFINKTLFDGSDIEGPIEVNAFIGKPANAMANIEITPKMNPDLLNGKARNVEMAFFPLIDEEIFAADYEMNALFHENSVISDMYIDYDEFSIRQKLVALEKVNIDLDCKEK